jgi:hypothetical protein
MKTKQELSKETCAKYGKAYGDDGQMYFKLALNQLILKGLDAPAAEAEALRITRVEHPGFTPRLAPTLRA